MTSYTINEGDYGISVYKLQSYLNTMQKENFINTTNNLDGIYGKTTKDAVKEWQAYANINVDGIIGYNTWNTLVDKLRELGIVTNIPIANKNFYLGQGQQGLAVYKIQEYINELAEKNPCLRPISIDGIYGEKTEIAIQQYQYLYDLVIDGIVGSMTWDSIINERNKL